MMKPSLDDPHRKLARGDEHLETLRGEITEFMRHDPYGVWLDKDSHPGRYLYRLKVHRVAPPNLGVLIGDVVHNFRSCLDHIAWQVALTTTSTPYSKTEFPIFKDPKPSKPGSKGFDPDGLKKIRCLPYVAQKFIESKQPYHRTQPLREPLWLLHEISNTDKHQIIVGPAPGRKSVYGGFSQHWGFAYNSPLIHPGPRDDGDVVVSIGAPPANEYADVRVTFTVGVNLPQCEVPDILNILNRVRYRIAVHLLPRFERFFDRQGPGY